MLIKHDEIVEETHRRTERCKGHLFVQRQAGRAVEMIQSQDAARLLRERGATDRDYGQQSGGHPGDT